MRPTARALLTHPFIANVTPHKTIIATLVEECIPKIRTYREQQAKEAAAKAGGDLDDNEDDDFAFDTNRGDTKTMVARTTQFGATSTSSADVSPSATLVINRHPVVQQPATIRFSGVDYATGPIPVTAVPPPPLVVASSTSAPTHAKAPSTGGVATVGVARVGTFRTGEVNS